MVIETTAQTWKSKLNFHSFEHHISLNFHVQQVLVNQQCFTSTFVLIVYTNKILKKAT